MSDQIMIRGARLHNLKNVTLAIPKNQFVVLTGVSGSGKSTLAFDILNKEGQRQYLEALGLVTFGLAKPPVDGISGLAPTVSIDQHLTNRSPRSTVGTVTDVYTYLRVLFARVGRRPCPACGRVIPPLSDASAEWEGGTEGEDTRAEPEESFPCPFCGAPVPRPSMAHFSFNKVEGACPACTGLGVIQQVDVTRLVDEEKSVLEGAVARVGNGPDQLSQRQPEGSRSPLRLRVRPVAAREGVHPAAARPAALWRRQRAVPAPLPPRAAPRHGARGPL